MNIFEEFTEALADAVEEGHAKGEVFTEEALERMEKKAQDVINRRVNKATRVAFKYTNKAINFAVGAGQIARKFGG